MVSAFYDEDLAKLVCLVPVGGIAVDKDENDRFVGKVINYNEMNKQKLAEEEEEPK